MGTRLTSDPGEHVVAMFDSVTGWAFGRVFSSAEQAEDFLRWLETADLTDAGGPISVLPVFRGQFGAGDDPRAYSNGDLDRLRDLWREQRLDDEGELKEETVDA